MGRSRIRRHVATRPTVLPDHLTHQAGMGIYRFCKYRGSFNEPCMQELGRLKQHFEVAADTLHPRWRYLPKLVGESQERRYIGHPHDWVVTDGPDAIPLRETYLQWDPDFRFEHLDSSIIDGNVWDDNDPRAITLRQSTGTNNCSVCGEAQSNDMKQNACQCYPNLYGGKQGPSPTQVFRTPCGKNNGLIACLVSTLRYHIHCLF